MKIDDNELLIAFDVFNPKYDKSEDVKKRKDLKFDGLLQYWKILNFWRCH